MYLTKKKIELYQDSLSFRRLLPNSDAATSLCEFYVNILVSNDSYSSKALSKMFERFDVTEDAKYTLCEVFSLLKVHSGMLSNKNIFEHLLAMESPVRYIRNKFKSVAEDSKFLESFVNLCISSNESMYPMLVSYQDKAHESDLTPAMREFSKILKKCSISDTETPKENSFADGAKKGIATSNRKPPAPTSEKKRIHRGSGIYAKGYILQNIEPNEKVKKIRDDILDDISKKYAGNDVTRKTLEEMKNISSEVMSTEKLYQLNFDLEEMDPKYHQETIQNFEHVEWFDSKRKRTLR